MTYEQMNGWEERFAPDCRGEVEIRWLYPPGIFPFVREGLTVARRTSKIDTGAGHQDGRVLVGVAIIGPEAKEIGDGSYHHWRRFFYLMPYDFDRHDRLYPPVEALDPCTVAPGVHGSETERCFIPPTPEQRAEIEKIFAARQMEIAKKRDNAAERQRQHRRVIAKSKASRRRWK
jgi:hypothetical protein